MIQAANAPTTGTQHLLGSSVSASGSAARLQRCSVAARWRSLVRMRTAISPASIRDKLRKPPSERLTGGN
ncbi:hypothetical protein [Scytonema sp. HK-05]|uniref:hypothetical protein n=1 Tax=Scytonema sp. HK-05 TaxID=1137095 RepID=UPI0011613DF3|nr:hypothetical protein [Scytonema sp. HK-05]